MQHRVALVLSVLLLPAAPTAHALEPLPPERCLTSAPNPLGLTVVGFEANLPQGQWSIEKTAPEGVLEQAVLLARGEGPEAPAALLLRPPPRLAGDLGDRDASRPEGWRLPDAPLDSRLRPAGRRP